jgi:5-deoxy-D-glucuronate isomerase
MFRWLSGSKYDGEYQNGKRHVSVSMVVVKGVVYDGQWLDNKEHKHGEHALPHEAKYESEYQSANICREKFVLYVDGPYP